MIYEILSRDEIEQIGREASGQDIAIALSNFIFGLQKRAVIAFDERFADDIRVALKAAFADEEKDNALLSHLEAMPESRVDVVALFNMLQGIDDPSAESLVGENEAYRLDFLAQQAIQMIEERPSYDAAAGSITSAIAVGLVAIFGTACLAIWSQQDRIGEIKLGNDLVKFSINFQDHVKNESVEDPISKLHLKSAKAPAKQ